MHNYTTANRAFHRHAGGPQGQINGLEGGDGEDGKSPLSQEEEKGEVDEKGIEEEGGRKSKGN